MKNPIFVLVKKTIVQVFLFVFITMISCSKESDGYTSASSSLGPVNIKLASVTATTALFTGTIDVVESLLYMECGFIYSTEADLSENKGTRIKITSVTDNRFEEMIKGLPYDQDIFFAPYYRTAAGLYVVGNVNKFKTRKLTIDIKVDETSAKDNCIDMTCSVSGLFEQDKYITIGVCYDYFKNSVQYGSGICREFAGVTENNTSTITLYDLHLGVPCYYCYYTEINGVRRYGEEREFTAPDPYSVVKKDLNLSSAIDLSKSGTANCYIVSHGGVYKFNISNVSNPGLVESCTILWESFGTNVAPNLGDLISGICYKDDYIVFETSDTFKKGNAVVAAKDSQGAIVWSWHIWFTDEPKQQICNNKAGIIMDRNLGATSAISGDVCSIGLVYQWGRKDPFVTNDNEVKSTIKWPSRIIGDSIIGSISYANEHPTTRIVADGEGLLDWLYIPSDYLWKRIYGNEKTDYDPCPAGWRVPDATFFRNTFGGNDDVKVEYDSVNKGVDLSDYTNSLKSWFPEGLYHTSTASPISGWVRKLQISNKDYGCYVELIDGFRAEEAYMRCVKE